MSIQGIDLASHQGRYDFAAAKREGREFAIIKVSGGHGYQNPERDQQITRAREAGLAVGLSGDVPPSTAGGDVVYRVLAKTELLPDCLAAHPARGKAAHLTDQRVIHLGMTRPDALRGVTPPFHVHVFDVGGGSSKPQMGGVDAVANVAGMADIQAGIIFAIGDEVGDTMRLKPTFIPAKATIAELRDHPLPQPTVIGFDDMGPEAGDPLWGTLRMHRKLQSCGAMPGMVAAMPRLLCA